jgi:hypothetical protein
MFSFLSNDKNKNPEVYETVVEGLKSIYKQKLLPLESYYQFHEFHSPKLEDPDFDARPMILLVGQYSTGKTTFIKYLLEKDFPGIRIGPEPTTDSFIAVMHGKRSTQATRKVEAQVYKNCRRLVWSDSGKCTGR